MTDRDFSGFAPQALRFLEDLAANNNRDWFMANKRVYETRIKEPAALFCAEMEEHLARLTGDAHRAKVFRIYRDVRFSKDKTPYNAHLHISFTPESPLASPPMWFFGLGVDRVSLGCGVFAFDRDELSHFRSRLDSAEGDRIAAMLDRLRAQGVRIGEPDLKRVPQGFDRAHRHADLLRHKGLGAWIDHDDRRWLGKPDVCARVMGDFERLKPVFDCIRPNR